VSRTENGTQFEVFDQRALEILILKRYFRHGNFFSLARQLHMYKFLRRREVRSRGYTTPGDSCVFVRACP
jgi:hypothetical protein